MPQPGGERVLFCFTGADDAFCLTTWLLEQRYEVYVLLADIGQSDAGIQGLQRTARQLEQLGCAGVFMEDCRSEFITEFVYPAVQAKCALGVPLSAPCIGRRQMEVAMREGITKVAHGARGDAQIQLELVYYALNPMIQVLAPWRCESFLEQFPTQEDLERFRRQHGLPEEEIPRGVWRDLALTYTPIDDLQEEVAIEEPPEQPPAPDLLHIEFKDGAPVKVTQQDGGWEVTDPLEIFNCMNSVGRKHGVGRLDRVDDLEVGVKGRVILESPGQTILAVAHTDVEGIGMDREVMRLRDLLSPKFTALVRGGCRFSPEMDFIAAAISKSQELIDGVVTVRVWQGVVFPTQRESCRSLFDRELSSMAIPDSFEPSDVEGFIKIHSLRLRAHHAILTKHTPRAPSRWPAATLTLEDGTLFEGRAFGQPISVSGEVVFTTGMVGYTESLTDPSYRGQILVLTFPLIGNYGIPPMTRDSYGLEEHFESFGGKIHVAGLVVSEYCEEPSHWNASISLSKWLKSQNVPAIMMVDTRALVKHIRQTGSILGKIMTNYDVPWIDPNKRCLAAEVSVRQPVLFGNSDILICCVDMGVKLNTIRLFLQHGVSIKVVPWDWDIRNEEYDGLFISNGPGDPTIVTATIENVKWALGQDKPIFGICMGNLVLGLAAGCRSYKLKYGNRGQNQPCINHKTRKCIITTQNHGYAIDNDCIPPDWEVFFTNANDKSNEGLRHKTKPFFSVQFHPEARCGPSDSEYLFDEYIDAVKRSKIEEYVNNKPKKVLVLGAGGTTIGQAGEFDYSGSQCLKALREEGIVSVLINPNVATVQTAPGMADVIYSTPLTPLEVEKVIARERPDGILLGFGGQTALNCGLQLHNSGILKRHGVKVLGTSVRAIEISEDREMFADTLKQIGEKLAPSLAVSSVADAALAAAALGYPVMCRAAYSLGGLGSGIVHTEEELRVLVQKALASSPQVLVERSLAGWKEVEYEVVRDIRDNCITVCNMENLDPMGIHTGDSIVVAPSQTLTNDEYHMLRSASIKVIRQLGIVGECNIQYGLDPGSREYVVIEVNARLSRSSALASKATGYPLAHVATKLALGISLPDIVNAITKGTTSCFEPSLDYVVVKVPRWDLDKFSRVSHRIGSVMKSVGEAMGIGRCFQEAFQKALRMADSRRAGFEPEQLPDCRELIERPTPQRIFAVADALREGVPVDQIHEWSRIDCWFLEKMRDIVQLGCFVEQEYRGCFAAMPQSVLWELKAMGFSDAQIAGRVGVAEADVRARRHHLGVAPFVKQIDTVAAEFPADLNANYLYLTYNASFDDIEPAGRAAVVLGSGVYRIGSSVEFDYCGVMALRALQRRGVPTVMINSNPETVSTDYDESGHLYFEELSLERVLDICEKETALGVIVSVGGQTAQGLAGPLKRAGVQVLGTDPDMIDAAEDRCSFARLCDQAGVAQPEWAAATGAPDALAFAAKVSYPVLLRPSYVLSGSAMTVAWQDCEVAAAFDRAARASPGHPVVVTQFIGGAQEFDVDLVAHDGRLLAWAVSEHVESAGVHSGDATLVLPPQTVRADAVDAMRKVAQTLAVKLCVCGPLNVQLLRLKDGTLKVIEANLRASRSVPFAAKVTGVDFCEKMVDAILSSVPGLDAGRAEAADMRRQKLPHIGVKAPVFSFQRLDQADPVLGVEMLSTGEVGCYGRDFHEVFLKAMLCAGLRIPRRNVYLCIDTDDTRQWFLESAQLLAKRFQLYAAPGTAHCLKQAGVAAEVLHSPKEVARPNFVDMVNGQLHLVIHLRDQTRDAELRCTAREALSNGYLIRRSAIDFAVPLVTDPMVARLLAAALAACTAEDLMIEPYHLCVAAPR